MKKERKVSREIVDEMLKKLEKDIDCDISSLSEISVNGHNRFIEDVYDPDKSYKEIDVVITAFKDSTLALRDICTLIRIGILMGQIDTRYFSKDILIKSLTRVIEETDTLPDDEHDISNKREKERDALEVIKGGNNA